MEEKRTNNTKKGILIGVGISALLLAGFLGSYAYFMGNLGSNKNEEVSTQTGTLALTFADGNNGITEALEFGGSVEKTFSIQNTGSLDATTRIVWDDLVNTYNYGSLTYSLSSFNTIDGTYTNIIENQNVPISLSSSKKLLAGNLTIPKSSTKYYKLIITLNYLDDVDQTADLKASLSTHFSVDENIISSTDVLNELNIKLNKEAASFNSVAPKYKYKERNENNVGILTSDTQKVVYSSSYTFNENTGTYTLVNPVVTTMENFKPIAEGKYGRYGWETTEPPYRDLDVITKFTISVEPGSSRMMDGFRKLSQIDVVDKSKDGVYQMEDDYGMSYYFRGAVENNNIKFAGLNWKIVRINGNGSLRIIYSRTSSKSSNFNNASTSIEKTGYMYGDSSENLEMVRLNNNSSTMKTALEQWYKTNIYDKDFDKYVDDAIFCNDRSIPGRTLTHWTEDTGLGYKTYTTGYGALARLLTGNNTSTLASKNDMTPSFKCLNLGDAFTKEDKKFGNGKLEQKVGLITADEIVAAGGKYGEKNTRFYLSKNVDYPTMSPAFYKNIGNIFILNINGALDIGTTTTQYKLVPVINLKFDYVSHLIGDGTVGNPYRLPNETA